MELQRKSSGVARGGLATGIVGTALGGLNSLALLGEGVNALGGLGMGRTAQQPVIIMEGGGYGYGYGRGGDFRDGHVCSEDRHVNRYELELQQKLAEKDAQIALRDANTYGDQKMLEMYKYIDGQLKDIRGELGRQAVINQQTADSFVMAEKDLQCCCDKLAIQIERERDERRCNDNTIITYVNGMFYPIQKADLTIGTTSTARTVYNPLCCDCGNNQ